MASFRAAPSSPEAVSSEKEAKPLQPVPLTNYAGYRSLVSRAVEVFGDEIRASMWLSRPCDELDGQTPLEVAQKAHYDSRSLEDTLEPLFLRIEHGVYY